MLVTRGIPELRIKKVDLKKLSSLNRRVTVIADSNNIRIKLVYSVEVIVRKAVFFLLAQN